MDNHITSPRFGAGRWLALIALSWLPLAASEIVQSTDRPFGLDVVAPVQAGGSDAESAAFMQNDLGGILDFLDQRLGERVELDDSLYALDPSKLVLQHDADIRLTFLGEGAGYHNSFGITTSGPSDLRTNPGDAELVFADASTNGDWYDGQPTGTRSENTPVLAGDFVDVGTLSAGTMMDFFLIANGANGGTTTWWTDETANPDGLNHVVAFAPPGSSYLIIGFEDLYGGGDQDYNDLMVALEIGQANVRSLISGNEPLLWLLTAALLGLAVVARRKGLLV